MMASSLILFVLTARLVVPGSAQESLSPVDASLSPQTTIITGTATDRYRTTDETPTQEEQDLQSWTNWSEWTTCSSTLMPGFRIRSRFCPKRGDCPGDDVRIKKCNSHDPHFETARDKFSKKYIEQCKNMGKSLSCKLYLENPDLAYDIFRQNSCFFTVNNDDNGDSFQSENDTLAISENNGSDAENDDGDSEVLSLNSQNERIFINENENQEEPNREKEGREEQKKREDDDDLNSNYSSYSINVIRALVKERKCKAHCDNTMNQAARLWALGTNGARSAESTIALLNRNGRLSTGVGVMFYEYNSCLSKCNSLGNTYSLLSGKEKNKIENLTADIRKLLGILEQDTKARTRNEDVASPKAESLCGENAQGCMPQKKSGLLFGNRSLRRKRQISQLYESACFSSENRVPVKEIEDKVNAELYFYKSYVQRFTCRKCRGTERGKTGLFMPKEQVLQRRNDEPAYCRQGYLTRHALFIVEDPKGRYTFSTGERFSIQYKSFEVESHCEIVILK